MQDRAQKRDALRYAVAKRWFPQLELQVATSITIAKSPTHITDIDVFAAVPDDFVGFRKVVIDCKTKRGESPISRAMWQKGLMERLHADRGLCILRIPRIEPDHRYTASQLGVTLLTESEFAAYVAATTVDHGGSLGCIAKVELWDSFFGIGSRFRQLEPAVAFSRSGFWMSETAAEACTRTIFLVSRLRGELDPDKNEHIAIVADLTALLCHALAGVVINIFASYLQPGDQDDLSRALLYFLYGGKNSYDHLNRIRRLIVTAAASGGSTVIDLEDEHTDAERSSWPPRSERRKSNPSLAEPGQLIASKLRRPEREVGGRTKATARDLQLPEWNRFVELVRQLLDAPLEVSRAPLLLRELGWAALEAGSSEVTEFSRTIARESPYGARFAVLVLDYLCRAARIPREFNERISGRLLTAQMRS